MAINPTTIEEFRKMMKKQLKNKYQIALDDEEEIDDPFIEKKTDGSADNPYHCIVCDCWMNSARVVRSHINGNRHIQKTKNRTVGGRIPVDQVQTACLAIELVKKEAENVPVVGLDYVVEYHPESEGEVIFDCELCNVKTQVGTFVTHVTGSKHRLAYLRMIDEKKYYEVMDMYPKKSELTVHLAERMGKMEKKFGQGEVTIVRMKKGVMRIQETLPQSGPEITDDEPLLNRMEMSFEEAQELINKLTIKSQADAIIAVNVANYIMEAILQYQLKQLPASVHQAVKESFNNGDATKVKDMISFHNIQSQMKKEFGDTIPDIPRRAPSPSQELGLLVEYPDPRLYLPF